jgi:hypothetical protein
MPISLEVRAEGRVIPGLTRNLCDFVWIPDQVRNDTVFGVYEKMEYYENKSAKKEGYGQI